VNSAAATLLTDSSYALNEVKEDLINLPYSSSLRNPEQVFAQ